MTNKEKTITKIIGIIGIIIVLVWALYKPIIKIFKNEKENISNTFEITYHNSKAIKLNTDKKQTNEKGISINKTKITIKNYSENEATYILRIGELTSDTLVSRSDIKIGYEIDNNIIVKYLSSLNKDLTVINSLKLSPNEEKTIYFYIWLDEYANNAAIGQDYKIELISDKLILTKEEAEDKTAPVIELNGDKVININKGEKFTDPGVKSIIDDIDGSISTNNMSISYTYISKNIKQEVKEIDTNKVGIYYIYYRIYDYANNLAEVSRILIIKDKDSNSENNTNNNNNSDTNNNNNNGDHNDNNGETEDNELSLTIDYSSKEITRGTVSVIITSNKELYEIEGFNLSDNKKILTKKYGENTNSELIVIATDGTYKPITIKIENIDNSEIIDPEPSYTIPTLSIRIISVKSNSITFKAIPSDYSKISNYYFSCDGINYNLNIDNNYTCSNLAHNTSYNLKAKVIDIKKNEIESTNVPTKTIKIEEPQIINNSADSWEKQKNIIINYGNREDNYIYQYKISNNNWITLANGIATDVELTENTTLTARIIDSPNLPYNETITNYIETKIDNTPPTCTIDGPFTNENLDNNSNILNNGDTAYYKITCTDNLSGLKDKITTNNINSSNGNIISNLEIIKTEDIKNGNAYTIKSSIGTGVGESSISINNISDNALNITNNITSKNVVTDNQAPIITNNNLVSSNVTKTSFNISWNKATDNTTDQNDLKYYVCISESNNINNSNCKVDYLKETKNNISSYNFINLSENKTYYANVLVEDSFGYQSLYNSISVTTNKTEVITNNKLDIANKSNLVSILYSTWFDYMHSKTPTIYDNTNGPTNYSATDFVYWGKPALGYYSSTDKNVIKNHLSKLSDAGIDFIILDITNVTSSWFGQSPITEGQYYNYVVAPTKVIMESISEMRKSGLKTPSVVPWIKNNNSDLINIKLFLNIFVNNYDTSGMKALGYDKEAWKDNFVYWDNKPFILTTTSLTSSELSEIETSNGGVAIVNRGMYSDRVSNFTNNSYWTFLQYSNTHIAGSNEQISVAPAVQQTYMSNQSTAKGRENGKTFYNQWQNAFNSHPKVVVISSWNEWGSEAITVSGALHFTDNYNENYSRDIEPELNGMGSTYYNWMKQYISSYKSNSNIPSLYN